MAHRLGFAVMVVISAMGYGQKYFRITRSYYDLFIVPMSNCSESRKECTSYHRDAFATTKSCQCSCPYDSSTFGFFNNLWTCIDNVEIRSLSGCNLKFQGEHENQPLKAFELNHSPPPSVFIQSKGCYIDFTKSQYLGCNGTWSKMSHFKAGNAPITVVEENLPPKNYKYSLYISNVLSLRGKVIKLAFKCPSALDPSCVLFKVEGETTCALSAAPKSSTVQPTSSSTRASSPDVVLLTTVVSTNGQSSNSERGPSSGTIAAIIIIILIIIIVVILIGYIWWKKKRGDNVLLLDQLTGIVSKVRKRPSSKEHEEGDEMNYQGEHVDADISEERDNVDGRSFPNEVYLLTLDIQRHVGGESEDGPVGNGRPPLTDEEGYLVPQDISRDSKLMPNKADHNHKQNTPRKQLVTDEDGYATMDSHDNDFESDSQYDYVKAGEIRHVLSEDNRESRASESDQDSTKRTRRRPPSSPRKI